MMYLFNYINWDLIKGEGLIITFIGYIMVFAALVLLYLVSNNLPKLLHIQTRRELKRKGKKHDLSSQEIEISGEVNAAIGATVFAIFNEMHDVEDTVITIKRISKNYSPWSSKIYGVTRGLNRKF